MSSNKLESRFVKRVNTHKGCWYHSWQDHDPGLMMSNQIKWQGVTSPPWFCLLQQLWRPSSNKPESCFVKRVNTHEGCWYHSWQDHNPSLMMNNQIKWRDSLPPDSVSCNNYEGPQIINLNLALTKESTPMKDVGTTVDKTTIPFKWWAIKSNGTTSSLPPDSASHSNHEGLQAMNLNPILTKELTPTKDVGTTVDKTVIPV
jgi:hypothetical protein